jgi:hypothetical protein
MGLSCSHHFLFLLACGQNREYRTIWSILLFLLLPARHLALVILGGLSALRSIWSPLRRQLKLDNGSYLVVTRD